MRSTRFAVQSKGRTPVLRHLIPCFTPPSPLFYATREVQPKLSWAPVCKGFQNSPRIFPVNIHCAVLPPPGWATAPHTNVPAAGSLPATWKALEARSGKPSRKQCSFFLLDAMCESVVVDSDIHTAGVMFTEAGYPASHKRLLAACQGSEKRAFNVGLTPSCLRM